MTAEEERSLPNGHGPLPNGNIDKNSTADDHSPDGATEHSAGGSTEETTPPAKEGTEATPEATPEATREAIPEGQEVVLIQDTGFTIQISCPGMEPFDLPVSSMELVQEIYQVLVDKEETCHRTCFCMQLDGVTLDNFAELKVIEGLKEGSLIKVIEEPYTVREARIHVRHIRDLLKSVDNLDAYNGMDCNSLSFLNVVSSGNLEKKPGKIESIDCTPPDYIMPGSKERPLMQLHPTSKEQRAPQCVKVLTFSGWNPPPGNRKMHGDVLYLYVLTMEDKRCHITASTRGFFVNLSTQDDFNPKQASPKHCCHSLIDLLSQISPTFKRNFQILLKKRAQKHPFERVATPYQVYSWLSPNLEHTVDSIRAEDAFSSRLGYEEHIPGQTRDWNEELQTTREMPRKNLPERLIRERAIFKVHSDFVVAATRGSMAVIDGNIMAINPGEDAKMQMYLWNNIFFSLGFDVKDHYKDFGGDAAAYVAPGSDLQGVKAYSSTDLVGLFTLGTVVVDYRGYRVTAQSIIPGILEKEQEQSVVYGSIDFGKTIVTHDKYKELLQKTAVALKFCPHKVTNNKDEEIELLSSVECKGIIGNDGRHYILDMLRTFPPDVNYLEISEEISPEMKSLGFPKQMKHKLACLRQELIDAFYDNRYVIFVKHAAFHLQQIRAKKLQEEKEKAEKEKETPETSENLAIASASEEDMETEVAKKIVKELSDDGIENKDESSTKEVVKKAARSVGSLSDTEFIVAFNTNVFQPHVSHVDPEGDRHTREKQIVKDASEFLVLHQMPNFIRDCLEHTSSPIDGYTLTEAMHHNGINMRYLGLFTGMVAKYDQLSYLHSICVLELITRTVKRLYKIYIQGVEVPGLSAAISHFLNCLLGSYPTPHTPVAAEELQSSRARKRNKKKSKLLTLAQETMEWATETPKTLWKKITDEMEEYFDFNIDCDSLDSAVEKYNLQKFSLLRSVCKRVGIQILLREYQFDSKTKQTFFEEDILNTFPIVKHIHPKASDAYHVFTSGQAKIQQGLLREGYELISEALNLLNNVYGAMHPEIAACARLLARLNYIMGDYQEALLYQQRAVLMSERVLGVDHPNTITEYAHLALYCFANNQVPTALKLMYRARYLALICHGENHPEVALFDSNIGLILQAVGEFDLSLRFLDKALELNNQYFSKKSLKVAMSYHLVARTHSCKGDFRTALHNEKEAYTIYKQLLGEDHERTKESTECLRHLTQQAVKFQKTMNQLSKGEKISNIPPLQIQTPSLSNVLDTLNLINGIVFVHISQEDVERFREEMLRRQQNKSGASDDQKSLLQQVADAKTSIKNETTNATGETTNATGETTNATGETSNANSETSNAKDAGSIATSIKDTNNTSVTSDTSGTDSSTNDTSTSASDTSANDTSATDTNGHDALNAEEEAVLR